MANIIKITKNANNSVTFDLNGIFEALPFDCTPTPTSILGQVYLRSSVYENDKLFVVSELKEINGVAKNYANNAAGVKQAIIDLQTDVFFTNFSATITGVSTEAKQNSQLTVLNNMLTVMTDNKNFEETVWKDADGIFYIRRVTMVNGVPTVTYLLNDGSSYVPVEPSTLAVSNHDVEICRTNYIAVNSGTGYSAGDWIAKAAFFNVSVTPALLLSEFWYNLSSGVTIAAPLIGDLQVDIQNINNLLLLIKNTDGIKKIVDVVTTQRRSNFTYQYISTNATFPLKSGTGVLRKIINLDNTGTLTIYDNTTATGTLIAVIAMDRMLGENNFDIEFTTGLTVVNSGGSKFLIVWE